MTLSSGTIQALQCAPPLDSLDFSPLTRKHDGKCDSEMDHICFRIPGRFGCGQFLQRLTVVKKRESCIFYVTLPLLFFVVNNWGLCSRFSDISCQNMVKLVEMNHAILWEPYAATPSEVLIQNILYTASNLEQFSSLNLSFLYFFRDSSRLFSIQHTLECGLSSILNYLKKKTVTCQLRSVYYLLQHRENLHAFQYSAHFSVGGFVSKTLIYILKQQILICLLSASL